MNFVNDKLNNSYCSVVVDDKLVELIPLNLDYSGEMNGGILSLQIHQLYKNNTGEEGSPDRKAVLVLPQTRTQCISGIDCILNGEKIDLKIEDEKKAADIEKEGEKQGRTTIRSVTTEDEQFLNIQLGSISYGSDIDITIRMEIISTNSDSTTYQTVIPFSEQALDPSNPDNFTFSIVFNEIVNITDIDITCSYERSDFEFTFDGSVLTIDKKPIGPIVLLTKLSNEIPSIIQNDLSDEYSVISVIPHFQSKPVNSDFIFIVDCSGSMSGSRIRNASECLSIFLHSLPVGCKFNIILFGTDYRSVFGYEGLVEYNEENLERAEKAVKELKANMGGTNLLRPLSTAYEQCESMSKNGNVTQIFLLTDGEIHDTETVFKLVRKNRSKSRIFSLGIGRDADRNLVCGLAVLSFGKFDFVSESTQITDKVINMLSLSLAPAMTNVTVHASSNEDDGNELDSLEIVPNPMTPIYDGSLMTIYVKRAINKNPIEHVLINGMIGDEESEILIDEVANICDFSAKKLFAFNAINDYEKMYDDLSEKNRYTRRSDDTKNELEKLKDRIVTLSVENKIISKFTSYIGVENKPHKKSYLSSDDDDNDYFEGTIGAALDNGLFQTIGAAPERFEKDFFDAGSIENEICMKCCSVCKEEDHAYNALNSRVIRNCLSESDDDEMNEKCYSDKCEMVSKCSLENDDDCDYFCAPPRKERISVQPPPQKPKVEKTLRGIIESQDFDGKWKAALFDDLFEFLVGENDGQAFKTFISSLGISGDDAGNIQSTVAALCILYKNFEEEKIKWHLIDKKAFHWLKSKVQIAWETEIPQLASQV